MKVVSDTFNSLFKVLFSFPSRYFYAIDFDAIFSLRWDLPPVSAPIPKNTTLCLYNNTHLIQRLRGCNPPWRLLPQDFSSY